MVKSEEYDFETVLTTTQERMASYQKKDKFMSYKIIPDYELNTIRVTTLDLMEHLN